MITKKGTPVIPALAHLEALTGGALTIAKLLRTLRENDGATQEAPHSLRFHWVSHLPFLFKLHLKRSSGSLA
jgi:hypothetical protein